MDVRILKVEVTWERSLSAHPVEKDGADVAHKQPSKNGIAHLACSPKCGSRRTFRIGSDCIQMYLPTIQHQKQICNREDPWGLGGTVNQLGRKTFELWRVQWDRGNGQSRTDSEYIKL